MAKNKQIAALNELGQSVWIDNLSRELLKSGELARLIDEGVSGLTSNPTIFKQAIADTTSYDQEIKALSAKGVTTAQICEDLMVKEVGEAADVMRKTYDATDGGDGCVSLEVSPFLAHDTNGTVEEARKLWKRLSRPNIMIKVPATPEGIPAIQTLLTDGINVNVTLIFSSAVYLQVAEAYIRALETRAAQNQDVSRIASVASFFVSRVDAIHEKKFDELVSAGKAKAEDKNIFLAKLGIANSKLAYREFDKLFGSERFKKLTAKKARVQRPLWASTGTKNPKFSPTLYVEELAGKHTVNTMPPATLTALLKGATISPKLHAGWSEAQALVKQVEGLGLPVETLLHDLQVQGVKLFADAFQELLDSIETKKKGLA